MLGETRDTKQMKPLMEFCRGVVACALAFAFAASAGVFAEARAQTGANVDECALGTDTCGAENLCGDTESGFVCGAHCPNGFVRGSARTECAATCNSATHIRDADNNCVPLADARKNIAAQICNDAGWNLKIVSSGATSIGVECPIPYRDATAQTDESGCWVSSQNLSTARSQGLTTASQYCWELFTQSGAPLASGHNADDRYVHTCPDGKEPGADLKTCVCPDGYVTDRDGSCTDINECAADANTCGANDACVNTVGGHACECGPGHSKISETLASQCADIDECAAGTDSCGAENLCENTVGGFTCTPCPAGFTPNGDRGECVPDPACLPGETQTESGTCLCDATEGRSVSNGVCAPSHDGATALCTGAGWEAEEMTFSYVTGGDEYVAAIECRIPYRNVAAQTDEEGCFLFLAESGITEYNLRTQAGATATKHCNDLFIERARIPRAANHNAGDRYVHSCPAGRVISDDLQSCVCPQGRVDIDGTCADINECADNTHACGENTLCVNTHGGYQCACESGHEFNPPTALQCADINECAAATDSCGANALCANTLGGHICGNECPAGFTPSADRSECVESDPCPAGETRDENGDCMCDPETRFINTGFGNACHITASAATQMCRHSGWNVVTVFHNSVTLGAVCAIPYRDETAQTDETGCSLWQNYRHAEFAHWDSHQTTSQRCRNLFDARPVPTTLNHNDGDRYVHSCPGGKIPTADSKRCVCPEGWTEDDSGMCSADINECATNTHTCGANAQCVNTEGGHACECNSGYAPGGDWTLQNPQCADIDECAAETDSCGPNSLCDNIIGGFICGNECPSGFIPNDGRSECVDASVCPPLHILDSVNGECVCDSAQAAYAGDICVPRSAATTCETAGWQTETHEYLGNILKVECLIPLRNATTKANEGGCFLLPPADNSIADYQTDATKSCYEIFGDDIPMTLTHAPNDRYVHTCPGIKTQSADHKTCECPSGYEENADGFCVDIDECAVGAHSCGENAQCVNTEGAHACACAAGYSSVGDWTFLDPQCRDVNECVLGTDNCGPNTLCGNLAGGYVCESACPEGTHVNILRTECEPCPPGEMQDENGECVCDPETRFRNTGYGGACHLTSDGATTTCLEAGWLVATVTHNNNVLGAVCKIPYRDETAKADETGCSLWHYLSHPDLDHWGEYETTSQRCRDLFDAYTVPLTLNHVAGDRYVHTCPPPKTPSDDLKSCDCPVGYEKDAEGNCVDINECETDSHTCGANAQCTNTPGEHICSCSPGYQSADASLQNLQCEDIDECSTGAHSCGGQDSAQCVNTDGDYECACYVNHAPLNPNDPKNPQCRGTYDLTLPQSANGTLYAKYGGATVTSAVNYVPQGVTVSLIAAPAPGFYILEWSGDCDHLRPGKPSQHGRPITCGLTMNAHKSAGATFARAWTTQFNSRPPEGGALSAKVKNGVTLQTGGAAEDGATVVYTAKPLPQFYLLEWGGECESEPGGGPSDRGAERTCERVLNSDHQVSVVFHRAVSVSFTSNPPNGTLSARVKNEGTTLQTGDIVAQGTTIVYAAQSDDGYYLQEWTGECANLPSALPEKYGLTATCEIADATGPIGALFAPAQRTTYDSQPPNGNISARIQGGITLQSGDIAPQGVTVVYKAKPDAAFYLRQWTGECENESGGAPSEFGLSQECARTLNTDHQVGAVFHRVQQVVFSPTASGGTLSARFKNGEAALPGVVVAQGTTVIYTAHPDDGYYLLEWTGGCAAQRPAEPNQHGLIQTCELDDASLPVAALFARGWKTTFDSTPPNGTLSARVQNGITLQSGHIAPQGATVIYTARPDPEFYLREWTGDCAGRPAAAPSNIGQTQTCQVTLTADSQAGAVFHRASPVMYVPDPPNGTLSAQTKDGAPLPPDHLAPEGTTVIYTARPDDGYYLLKWLGGCAHRKSAEPSARGQAQTCEVADAASAVEAVFERAWETTLNQPDNGTLSAENADGETLQSGDIEREGITVIFTVQPDSGFYLLEWSGACAGQPAAEANERGLPKTCELTLTAETTVGATFERAWETTFNQPDNGTLSAENADGETLQSGAIEREGTTVIFTAQPDSGFYLLEWSGTCAGQPAAEPSERGLPKTCELTLTAETTVGATFERAWETTFNQPDNGTLSAESADGETLQSGDIEREGITVIYTAQPDSGFYLLEWSGACVGQPAAEPSERGLSQTCELTLTAETTIGATFERAWETTLNQPDNGALSAENADGETLQSGTIERGGTTVTFTAQPDSGFYLLEWSGACAGQPAAEPSERGLPKTCELTLTAETTVGATFERAWQITFNPQPPNGALSARGKDGKTLRPGDIVREGTTVIFTAQPDAEHYLLAWIGDCGGSAVAAPSEHGLSITCELLASAATRVGANFNLSRPITFNALPENGVLSARSKEDGNVLRPGDFVADGATVVFTATPNPGFYMREWGAQACDASFDNSERDPGPQTCEAVADDSFGANRPAPIFSSSPCFSIQNARADGNNPDKCVCDDPNHLMFGEGANRFCAPPTICPAGYSDGGGDCIAPNASALPDHANSPEGCSKTFGGALRILDGQPICSEIDIQGTFCFVGSREIFPCRGLFKHVWKCNRLNRPALNPFTCDPVCSENGNIARGRHCGKQTTNGASSPPEKSPVVFPPFLTASDEN